MDVLLSEGKPFECLPAPCVIDLSDLNLLLCKMIYSNIVQLDSLYT